MKSLRIGSIAGIDVFLHSTFPLFVLVLAVFEGLSDGWLAGLRLVGVLIMLFGFVLLHELGHSLVALRYGVRVLSITLLPIGGLALTGNMPRRPIQEILIALAGPAVNLVIALALGALLLTLELSFDIDAMGPDAFVAYAFGVNVMLALFNLLPAFPLDGGRVLRALLALRFPYESATRSAVRVGQTFALGFVLLGVVKPTFLMLGIVGAFLLIAGQRELKMQEHAHWMRTRRVGDFLDPRPWIPANRDTRFGEICRFLFQEPNFAHCVVDLEGLRYGVLTRREMQSACLALPADLQVYRLVRDSLPALSAELPLDRAMGLLQQSPQGMLPVRQGPEILGVISLESLLPLLRQSRTGT